MKKSFLLSIIFSSIFLLNCSSSNKAETQKKVDIFLKGTELYIGDYLVDINSSIENLENVIGKPTRTK